jgi:hypothetical protein
MIGFYYKRKGFQKLFENGFEILEKKKKNRKSLSPLLSGFRPFGPARVPWPAEAAALLVFPPRIGPAQPAEAASPLFSRVSLPPRARLSASSSSSSRS